MDYHDLGSLFRWSITPPIASPHQSDYPSLKDLSEMLPDQIRLPQPTLLCTATTERGRREEPAQSSRSSDLEAATHASDIIQVHLRVHLEDFRSSSTLHFEVSSRPVDFRIRRVGFHLDVSYSGEGPERDHTIL